MQRKWLSAALGVALAVGVAAAAQAQEVLKIGGIGPLSGGGTAWGLAAQRGMPRSRSRRSTRPAASRSRARPTSSSSSCTMTSTPAQGGKAAAERLVNQDKVKFIIGPVGSPPALGVIERHQPRQSAWP